MQANFDQESSDPEEALEQRRESHQHTSPSGCLGCSHKTRCMGTKAYLLVHSLTRHIAFSDLLFRYTNRLQHAA